MKNSTHYYGIKNFVPSKKMGQNFLINDAVAQNIVHSIDGQKHDVIIEIGPGGGALTKYLLEFNKPLILIELDKRLVEQLKKQFIHHSNLRIINDDVLEIDLDKIVQQYKSPVLVSNLPYSISTPMILKFLQQHKIQLFFCMLQKELAQRILALPGANNYGSISVLVQSFASVCNILSVSSSCFRPQPKIDSNVVLFRLKQQPHDSSWAAFVQKCFAYKRKTLLNNLKIYFSVEKIKSYYYQNKISDNVRAEQLDIPSMFKLYKTLYNE